jgi:carbonic anhydrase
MAHSSGGRLGRRPAWVKPTNRKNAPFHFSTEIGPRPECFVIHHTDCGMLFFTDEVMRGLLASSLETAELGPSGFRDVGKGPGSSEGEFIDWLTMKNNAASLVADVRRIRNHPLIPKSIPVYGYIYDVRTGKLDEVPEAMAMGKAM